MTDLHIHSNCSDGSDDWKTILQRAENLGYSLISITDHDNCDVYEQISEPEKYFSGRIIPGIEAQAYYDGISIELLGFGFDVGKMQKSLPALYLPSEILNQTVMLRLYDKCVSLGMKFAPDVIERYDRNKYFFATEYLHGEMRKFAENRVLVPDIESWGHENIFFKRHTSNPDSPFYIDFSDLAPDAEKVIDTIHLAGGKVFVPHIFQYEKHSEMILNGLADNYEIDGIECYYPSFSETQIDYLLDFCHRRNLLVSGGSDYHGKNRPEIWAAKNRFDTWDLDNQISYAAGWHA